MGHKVNVFPGVMLPSAALGGLGLPHWDVFAGANLFLLWMLGWGEAIWGPLDLGQPTRFLRKLAHLAPTLGVVAAAWTFHRQQPMAFWITASVYFALVQWLSTKNLSVISFSVGWLCLWGLTCGGHFEDSPWNSLLVYAFSVTLALTASAHCRLTGTVCWSTPSVSR